MIEFSALPQKVFKAGKKDIHVFGLTGINIDESTVQSFGEEWNKFSQFNEAEISAVGSEYFDIVTTEQLNKTTTALDVGCGSGRWTKFVAGKVGFVEAVDPSNAVLAAASLLSDVPNVRISQAGADNLPFPDNSFDFVFSLGVLHHIPDTKLAMQHCIRKLKPGGYFLVYLYYALDNRGMAYKSIFYLSHFFRLIISTLPATLKKIVCDLIAVLVYMPFVYLTKLFQVIGLYDVANKLPLSYYADKSFNIIRNDALDRFGTPLEQRFTREEIRQMMEANGLKDIVFSHAAPFWHAVGKKA